jgi:hypothetical protein
MIDLRAFAGDRYRITLDELATCIVDERSRARELRRERLWLNQIQGSRGHIYVHGPETLGVFTDRRPTAKKLEALPGARYHQRGDTEVTILIPVDQLDNAATIVHARKRRRLTDEQKARLAAASAGTRFSRC